MKAYVLDTSAFIQGHPPTDEMVCFTVPSVKEEIKNDLAVLKYDNLRRTGILKEIEPKESFLLKIKEAATSMGEDALSLTDRRVLALSLQLKLEGWEVIIVTDDYSIQNLADKLNMGYKSLVTPGIKKRIKWQIYCPGCKKIFNKLKVGDICPICGIELKRRPIRNSGS